MIHKSWKSNEKPERTPRNKKPQPVENTTIKQDTINTYDLPVSSYQPSPDNFALNDNFESKFNQVEIKNDYRLTSINMNSEQNNLDSNNDNVMGIKHTQFTSENTKLENPINNEQIFAIKPNNSLRENSSKKIAERDLFVQSNQNPFLSSSNYVNDLVNQDNYLKPCNSNFTN